MTIYENTDHVNAADGSHAIASTVTVMGYFVSCPGVEYSLRGFSNHLNNGAVKFVSSIVLYVYYIGIYRYNYKAYKVNSNFISSEIFPAVSVQPMVFRLVKPYGIMGRFRRFGRGACCLHL
jgi:hypothetical protein